MSLGCNAFSYKTRLLEKDSAGVSYWGCILPFNNIVGVVQRLEFQSSKLFMGVRFASPAPNVGIA